MVADSVNVTRAPWVLATLVDGAFHRFSCSCGHAFVVEKELLYCDFDRRHWVGVFPPGDAARFVECGDLVSDTFREAFFERAPAIVASTAEGFRVRVVFGLAELREKVLCWLAGLEDHLLELLKLELLQQQPALVARGARGLVLQHVRAGALVFSPISDGRLPRETAVTVAESAYRDAARSWPEAETRLAELVRTPYVNVQRYWAPPPPTPGSARSSIDRGVWRVSRP
jgi:hypothetical protein